METIIPTPDIRGEHLFAIAQCPDQRESVIYSHLTLQIPPSPRDTEVKEVVRKSLTLQKCAEIISGSRHPGDNSITITGGMKEKH